MNEQPSPLKMCFFTPTFRRDLIQFSLLRRTIMKFAPQIPHLVIVNHEDLDLFRSKFQDQFGSGLTLKSSREVLPPRIEFGRWVARYKSLRSLFKRLPGHTIVSRGWYAQQIMKIYALANLDYDFAVFLESDVFLCADVTPEYFMRDGLPRLFEGPADTAEKMDFDVSTHVILGRRLDKVKNLYDYIFSPAIFRRSTAVRLMELLSERGPTKWIREFHRLTRPSEYNLLGFVAREIENHSGYSVEKCMPRDLHYSICIKDELDQLIPTLDALTPKNNDKKFFLLQSSLKIDSQKLEQITNRCIEKLQL